MVTNYENLTLTDHSTRRGHRPPTTDHRPPTTDHRPDARREAGTKAQFPTTSRPCTSSSSSRPRRPTHRISRRLVVRLRLRLRLSLEPSPVSSPVPSRPLHASIPLSIHILPSASVTARSHPAPAPSPSNPAKMQAAMISAARPRAAIARAGGYKYVSESVVVYINRRGMHTRRRSR